VNPEERECDTRKNPFKAYFTELAQSEPHWKKIKKIKNKIGEMDTYFLEIYLKTCNLYKAYLNNRNPYEAYHFEIF